MKKLESNTDRIRDNVRIASDRNFLQEFAYASSFSLIYFCENLISKFGRFTGIDQGEMHDSNPYRIYS